MKTVFSRLPLDQQRELLAKISHLMSENEFYYMEVKKLIKVGEVNGDLRGVRFGNEIKSKLI